MNIRKKSEQMYEEMGSPCVYRMLLVYVVLALLFCLSSVRVTAAPCDRQSPDQALHYALEISHDADAALAALDRGASANIVDGESGQTALLLACQLDDAKLVLTLLQHGARLNARDKNGNTTLIVLAQSEFGSDDEVIATANVLLLRGADINAANNSGQTALFVSQTTGRIAYLCSKGANVNARDKDGKTALMCFCATPPDDGGPGVWFPAVQILVDHGAHVNARDKKGWTALMRLGTVDPTEQADAVTTAKLLIAHGAKVRFKNSQGRTARQIAVANGLRDLAAYLKSVGG